MANEEILEEEESILTLTDENGEDQRFEYLDCVELDGIEYLVLMPEDSNEIVILEIQPVDEENENYVAVENEEILDKVYAIFKERYKDVLTFENRNGNWVETSWETVWSTTGSASKVIYPYWWHFIYGGF